MFSRPLKSSLDTTYDAPTCSTINSRLMTCSLMTARATSLIAMEEYVLTPCRQWLLWIHPDHNPRWVCSRPRWRHLRPVMEEKSLTTTTTYSNHATACDSAAKWAFPSFLYLVCCCFIRSGPAYSFFFFPASFTQGFRFLVLVKISGRSLYSVCIFYGNTFL